MAFTVVRKIPLLRWVLLGLARSRVKEKIRAITPYLESGDKVLDIGTGNGVIADTLLQNGYQVTPLDVANSSLVDSVAPEIYDGRRIPYPDGAYDVALLITVLHHIPQPEQVLAEASRVARRVVIIEEVYGSRFEQFLTYWIDSLFNLEFFGHPHSNKTDQGWKQAFRQLKLRLIAASSSRSLGVLRRVLYVVER